MSDEGRLVAGRYRISKRIGTGAMGAVWQAQDEVLGRTVAIKQLLLQPGLEESEAEEARQRTMREGRIAARLHHPNAITVFDVITDDQGQPCLIMEYLDSTSLAAVVQQDKALPPLEVARIGAQIAAALASAHRVDIVHRDIKPANILLTDDGVVKITDFGISRAKDDVTVTKTGMIAGTPAYLAPEVAIGEDPGPESDVFSLGSTLYAATEGVPPFGLSENTLGLLHAVAAGQINPPQQSGPLTSVLALLLHPEKARRPTAAEAEEMLDAVARGETPVGAPVDADPTAMVAGGVLAAGAAAGNGDAAAQTSLVGHAGSLDDAAANAPGDDQATTYQPAGFYADGHDGGTRTAVAQPGVPPDEPETESSKSWAGPAFAVGTLGVVAAFALWLFTSDPPNEPSQQQPVGSTSSTTTEPTTTSESTAEQLPVTTIRQEPQPEPEPEPEPTTTTTTTTTTPPQTTEPTTSSEPEPEPTTSSEPEPDPTTTTTTTTPPEGTSSQAAPTNTDTTSGMS